MNENTIERKSLWNEAAKSGLVLGGVSVAYMLLTSLLGKLQEAGGVLSALGNVTGIALWVAKLIVCIYLMKFFMRRFASGNEGVTNGDTFRFGTATALLSALIFSAFSLAWALFIQPDMYADSMELAKDAYSGMLSSEQLASLDELVPRMPTFTFFVNLIWCWLFGTVLSAIFSANIPPRNPFNENA